MQHTLSGVETIKIHNKLGGLLRIRVLQRIPTNICMVGEMMMIIIIIIIIIIMMMTMMMNIHVLCSGPLGLNRRP